jgi:hypothetical protein
MRDVLSSSYRQRLQRKRKAGGLPGRLSGAARAVQNPRLHKLFGKEAANVEADGRNRVLTPRGGKRKAGFVPAKELKKESEIELILNEPE